MTLVLLAVDDSESSIHAAHEARELFGPQATYLAVNVAEVAPGWTDMPLAWGGVYAFPSGDGFPATPTESGTGMEQAVDVARERASHAVDEAHVAAVPIGDVGDPVTEILRAADEHNADVIVVGDSDKNWWRRLLDGSVSNDVVRRAHRAVLVVPLAPK
jgi:nucleotide-binding universal stress UspA family protein